jgi:uncharacterized protein (DUF2147 family)
MRSNLDGLRRRVLPQQLLLAVLVLPLVRAAGGADGQAAQIVGNWLTEQRNGIIQISVAEDGTYQGRIVGGNEPQRVDQHNPDQAKRSHSLLGQIIFQGMKYDGDGKWSGGTIYDPDSGRSYKCRVEQLDQDRLQVRGFIGFALLGRSQVWMRYRGTSMTLPPTPQ